MYNRLIVNSQNTDYYNGSSRKQNCSDLLNDIVCVIHVHVNCICCRYMNDPVMVDLTSDRSLVPENVVHHVSSVCAYTCT